MKVISMVNKKGGTGKTTSVATLAYLVSKFGKRVLLIDLDPQKNLTSLYKVDNDRYESVNSIFLMLSSEMSYDRIRRSIVETEYNNIDIMPGYEDLDETIDLVSIDQRRIPQLILKNALSYVSQDYDYIFIDNTPYFNLLTRNGICASTDVLIPVDCNGFSYEGLNKLLTKIREIKRELNPSLDILGIFLTKVNRQTNLYKELKEEYRNEIGTKFMESSIRMDNSINESNTVYIPLPKYKKCNALYDYQKLLYELQILGEEEQLQLKQKIDAYENKLREKERRKNRNGQI